MIDTAGLRDASDEVERIGIARSWQAIADADAVLFLHDLSRADDAAAQPTTPRSPPPCARARGRAAARLQQARPRAGPALPDGALALSAQTGAGLDALRDALLERAGAAHVPDGVFIARTRHVHALARTDDHLQLAQSHADQRDAALDLFAEELRLAHGALGEITGQFTADDLLGRSSGGSASASSHGDAAEADERSVQRDKWPSPRTTAAAGAFAAVDNPRQTSRLSTSERAAGGAGTWKSTNSSRQCRR